MSNYSTRMIGLNGSATREILKLTAHGHNLLKQFFDSMAVKIIMCEPF